MTLRQPLTHRFQDQFQIVDPYILESVQTAVIAVSFRRHAQRFNASANEGRRRLRLREQRQARLQHDGSALLVNGNDTAEVGLSHLQQVLASPAAGLCHAEQPRRRPERSDVERSHGHVGPVAEVRYQGERLGRYV